MSCCKYPRTAVKVTYIIVSLVIVILICTLLLCDKTDEFMSNSCSSGIQLSIISLSLGNMLLLCLYNIWNKYYRNPLDMDINDNYITIV